MFKTLKPLILASASPRRKALLDMLGLQFRVLPADIDEHQYLDEIPEDYVCRMALSKAADIGARYPDSWVISADTIVVLDNLILDKPASPEEAVETLLLLSGREHLVKTGFCLSCSTELFSTVRTVSTAVRFIEMTRPCAEAYVATGEPMDKAGGYGIQGRGGVLVERIEGSYSNVVGLPLAELTALLGQCGILSPAPLAGEAAADRF